MLLVGAVQLVAGALSTGVTVDEPSEVSKTRSWLASGWYVEEKRLVDGQPDDGDRFASPYVYGPAFSSIAHVANVAVGNESIGEVSTSEGAFRVRHLVVAILGLLAALAVGLMIYVLTGSRRFGLWGSAGLLAIPAWTGNSFFNVKDIPAATGYTFLTTGLVLALRPDPFGRRLGPTNMLVGGLIGAGVFLGAGTRPSLLIALVASLAIYAVVVLGRKVSGTDADGTAPIAVALGFGAGLASVVVVYPSAATRMWAFLFRSVTDSSGFTWNGVTLTAGRLLPEHPPWWYLPAWFLGSLPVLLTVLACVGLWAGFRRTARPEMLRIPSFLLVVLQLALVPFGALVTSATMYGGLRQHLYAVPAVMTMAGVGAHAIWRSRSRWVPHWAVTAVLTFTLLLPTAEQLLLFPYNYTYVNAVAGIGGVEDRWETDLWFASLPETLSRVPRGETLRCRLNVPSNQRFLKRYDCDDSLFGSFDSRRGTDVRPAELDENEIWVIVRRRAGNEPPEFCRSASDVTRQLRTEKVTMAHVLICDAERA